MFRSKDVLYDWFLKDYIRFTGWDESGEPQFSLTAFGRRRLCGTDRPVIRLHRFFHGWLKCEWALVNAPWYWLS